MLGFERRRLAQAPPTGPVTRDLRNHIRWLERRVQDVDDELTTAIQAGPVWRGQRTIAGGRARVRRTLDMAAVVAARHNAPLRHFYQRLRTAGNPPKSPSSP